MVIKRNNIILFIALLLNFKNTDLIFICLYSPAHPADFRESFCANLRDQREISGNFLLLLKFIYFHPNANY